MKMNKKKSPNFLKTGILFFGISLLLFNCEKNENSHEHQEHQIAQIDHLDIEELPEIESALFGLNKVGTSKKNNTQSRSMQTNFGSLKLTNILEYANNDGKLTYSFSIDKEFSENQPYTFENLHLIKLEEGYLGYIIKWEPNHVWLENKNYNFILSDFTGIKTHYDLDYNIIQVTEFINGEPIDYSTSNKTSSKNQTFNRDVEIVCIDFISSLCNGVPYDCGGSICGFGSATFCSLSGSSGSSAENSTPTDSSGTRLPRGGGSSGSINGNAFVVPVIPSPLDLAINSFFNSLTDEEKDFLDNNNLEKEEIRNFLVKNYSLVSVEEGEEENDTFDFAYIAIGALMETFHETTFEELLEVLNFEQDYKSRMSESEIVIFESLSRRTQLLYLQSAFNAETLMQSFYPNSANNPCSDHNGQGDAFRHALWNALSTVRIGKTLTNQLTTAHENQPIPTYYTAFQYNKEKQMDLYNNAKGQELAYTAGLVADAVKNAKENGSLKYLSNLNSSNCLPTSNSNLISTD
jgi:hypothetical protein